MIRPSLSIATFEQAQAIAELSGRQSVNRKDIEKAAIISLGGRAEVSPSSQYYDEPTALFRHMVKDNLYNNNNK